MGCRLRLSPEVATRDFVAGVEIFINELEDQERKVDYHIALLATLQSQDRDISAEDFAESHIRRSDRASYRAALEAVGRDPRVSFEKDVSLAKAKGFKWYFEHGLVLIGSKDDVEEGRVEVSSDRQAPTRIFDSLKRLQGR